MNTLVKTNGNLLPTLQSFFDDFFGGEVLDWSLHRTRANQTLPSVNIHETNDSFILEVAAPGMTKKDFHVELDNNLLVISGNHEISDNEDTSNYTRREFSYTSFKRSFSLPQESLLTDKISASYKNGILTVTLPKSEEAKAKPVKQIAIN